MARGSALLTATLASIRTLSVAACGGGATAEGSASPSVAPTGSWPLDTQAQFLDDLGAGFDGVSDGAAASMAVRTCSALSEGSSAADITAILQQKGLTPYQANRLIQVAVSTYCPESRGLAAGG